jgi:hypothetical protein
MVQKSSFCPWLCMKSPGNPVHLRAGLVRNSGILIKTCILQNDKELIPANSKDHRSVNIGSPSCQRPRNLRKGSVRLDAVAASRLRVVTLPLPKEAPLP